MGHPMNWRKAKRPRPEFMRGPRHQCPIEGCAAEIFAGLLMCNPHWQRVPPPLKREVMEAWRAYKRVADMDTVARLRLAQAAAIAAVDAKPKALG